MKEIRLQLERHNLFGLVRIEVAKALNNIVCAENIELFRSEDDEKLLPWGHSLEQHTPSLFYLRDADKMTILCERVSYDTRRLFSDERVYRVRIFDSGRCPKPYLHQHSELVTLKFGRVDHLNGNEFLQEVARYSALLSKSLGDDLQGKTRSS